jgi:hypothetical protein
MSYETGPPENLLFSGFLFNMHGPAACGFMRHANPNFKAGRIYLTITYLNISKIRTARTNDHARR